MTVHDTSSHQAIIERYANDALDRPTNAGGRLAAEALHTHPDLRRRAGDDPLTTTDVINLGRDLGVDWVPDASSLDPETSTTPCPVEVSMDPVCIRLHNALTVETAAIALGTVLAIREGYSTPGPRGLEDPSTPVPSSIKLQHRSCLWSTRRSSYTSEERMHFYEDCPEAVWCGKVFAITLLYEQSGLLETRQFYINDSRTLVENIHAMWDGNMDLPLDDALCRTGMFLFFIAPESQYQVLDRTEHELSTCRNPRDRRIHETIVMFMKALFD